MIEFPRVKASKGSLSQRKKVFGVGINDAWYKTTQIIDGKELQCQAYSKWRGMISRCYSEVIHKRLPTYSSCTVCYSWIKFSNFELWYSANNVDGYDLDKDIKIKGNKMYSPSTCLFVPPAINHLLLDSKSIRGSSPIGVCYSAKTCNFRSYIKIDGKQVHLGMFSTKELASEAYVNAKNSEIKRKCEQYPELAIYLNQHMYDE